MLKNYIYALLIIIPLYVTAQPQFTSSNCFQVNDSSKLGFAIVNQNFDDFISATGDNYILNFTTT